MVQVQRITRMKERKEKLGWSCPRIVAEIEKDGEYIGISTVKNMFSPAGETMNYKERTLLLVEKALGLLDEVPVMPPETEEFLRSVIADQRQQIADLRVQNEEIKAERKEDRKKIKNLSMALAFMLVFNSFFLLVDRFTVGIGWYNEENPTGWIIKALCLVFFFVAIAVHFVRVGLKKKKAATNAKE